MQIDEVPNAFPIIDAVVDNLCNEETPQVITACGNGPRSTLRVLRQGIAVNERAVSSLPGVPSAVWSIKTHSSDQFDKYDILLFFLRYGWLIALSLQVYRAVFQGRYYGFEHRRNR